ncbi:MAG: response regulator transcription factor [Lewinellaceae bacterium]|nr:response regulator transcription factor [Lewinellaceae bacterium]
MKVFIVESDVEYALELKSMVEEMGHEVVGIEINCGEAVFKTMDAAPQLVIVNVALNDGKKGWDFYNDIKHLEIPCLFISKLHYRDIYEEILKIGNFPLLIRPFHKFTLGSIMRCVVKDSGESYLQKIFNYKQGSKIYTVVFGDILWLESDRNNSIIHFGNKKIVLRMAITSLLKQFKSDQMVRIHKSFAIPVFRLVKVDFVENVVDIGSHELPLGRSYKKQVKQIYHSGK